MLEENETPSDWYTILSPLKGSPDALLPNEIKPVAAEPKLKQEAEKEVLEGEMGSFVDAKGNEGEEREKALSAQTPVASPDVSEHTLVDSQMTR